MRLDLEVIKLFDTPSERTFLVRLEGDSYDEFLNSCNFRIIKALSADELEDLETNLTDLVSQIQEYRKGLE